MVTDFVDKTRQLAFISNILSSKQYKYLVGHQNTPTFIALMEAAATHTLTKEKMNPFLKSKQRANHTLQSSQHHNHHVSNLNWSHWSNKPSEQIHVHAKWANNGSYNPDWEDNTLEKLKTIEILLLDWN